MANPNVSPAPNVHRKVLNPIGETLDALDAAKQEYDAAAAAMKVASAAYEAALNAVKAARAELDSHLNARVS